MASPARPRSAAPDLHSAAPEEFTAGNGLTLTTSAPVVKAALLCLGEVWPGAVAFDVLLAQARARLGSAAGHDVDPARQDALALGKALLTAYASAGEPLVELSLRPPCFAAEVSERPAASPLARLQAESTHQVTNLRHEVVSVTPFDRQLLPYLDGTRDRPALVESLLGRVQRELMQISQEDQPVTDSERARAILAEVLEQQLPKLAQAALLLA